MVKKEEIAVLLACHNRKNKTLESLNKLFDGYLPDHFRLKVFLVDDGSTDGTGQAVRNNFPGVTVINGTGNLFWNKGMRLAWETAARNADFDYYLWLNDDTLLDRNAITEMLICLEEGGKRNNCGGLVTAACRKGDLEPEFSYGGRTEAGDVIPNGELQTCIYINGNAVLIPREVYRELGNLSPDYTHGMGDFDYGLRAIQKGFKCYTTKSFVATCPPNEGIPAWCNPEVPLKKRWKLLFSPLGLNLKEYLLFRKKFWKAKWRIYALKAYAKATFPKFYFKISQL